MTRWFLIVAPVLAGALLMIFGTDGGTSVIFGATLIGIGLIVWMWNWFIRMSFLEYDRDVENLERARAERAARSERQTRDGAPATRETSRDSEPPPDRQEPRRRRPGSPPAHAGQRGSSRLGRPPRRPS